ncbi:MAG TPA: hypothetical protein VM124_01495 [Candidatus Limnocylindrales bacterium]|nr:hypothetical protein [Candidatus Limnocylindrales bacterium]
MSSKKVFYILCAITGVLGLSIIGTVVLGDTLLHKQSDKLVSLKLNNQVIESQQASLVRANKDLQKYAELKTIAQQIVPQDKDQARATREIVSIADQAGIKISSITFPASNLGQAQPKATTPSSDDAPKPATPAAPPVTQVKAVDGIKGLYKLDITIVSDTTKPVTYAKLVDFLGRLEQNRRTATVSQISIQPDSQNRTGLNFTLTLTVYIKP